MKMHPLAERLISAHGATPLTLVTLDAFLAQPGDQAVLFLGNTVQFPEGADVAVVLPELRVAFAGRFGLGVVTPEDEDAIARRYGVQRWPSLVFLRDGEYVTALPGMRDWDVYLRDVAQALQAPVTRAPSIGIPLVSAHGADSHCH
jgi:hydrogenase-1 operon protein HyaE